MKAIRVAVAMAVALMLTANSEAAGIKAKGKIGVTMKGAGAAQIIRVAPNSPAARAGLRMGDTIVGVADEEVESADDVIRLVGQHKPGEKLEIIFDRRGLQGDVTVTLTSELDAFSAPTAPTIAPATPAIPASNGNRDPAWPPGYQPSDFESTPYQS